MESRELYKIALEVRMLYRSGQITRKEAKIRIKEYEYYYNKKALEIAKKYNQRPTKFSFNNFMR